MFLSRWKKDWEVRIGADRVNPITVTFRDLTRKQAIKYARQRGINKVFNSKTGEIYTDFK